MFNPEGKALSSIKRLYFLLSLNTGIQNPEKQGSAQCSSCIPSPTQG